MQAADLKTGDTLPGLGLVVEVTKRVGWARITFDAGQGYLTFDVPAGLALAVDRTPEESQVRPRRAASSTQHKIKFQEASPTPTSASSATTPAASGAPASASVGSSGIGVPAAVRPATSGPEQPGHS